MTNQNAPIGGKIFNVLTSARFEPRINKYVIPATDAIPLFINDFVKTTNTSNDDGIPIITKVTGAEKIRGIVVGFDSLPSDNQPKYREANTERIVYVCDDPLIEFEIQVNGNFSTNDVGKNGYLLVGSGNVSTGLSTTQLNHATLGTTDAQIKVLGLVERELNSLGYYAKVKCAILQHELRQSELWEKFGTDIRPQTDGLDVNLRSGGLKDDNVTTAINLGDSLNQSSTSTNKTIIGSTNENLTFSHSCGWISGGVMYDGGGNIIKTPLGQGYLRVSDSDSAELQRISWDNATSSVIPDATVWYIGISYTGTGTGEVVYKVSDTWNFHTEFRLGSVVREGSTLHILNNPWRAVDPISWITERFYEVAPFQRAERLGGIILGETGIRNITVSAGELYDATNEFIINAINTSGSDTFDTYLGALQDATGVSQWDNLNYNNGGVKTALGAAKYANLWFYIEADNNLVMLYGEFQHNTPATAAEEAPPATIPLRLQTHGKLIGRLLFAQGAPTATLIDSAFVVEYEPTVLTNHANLNNLSYDASGHGNGFNGFLRGATVSASNPTTTSDINAGYVVGDLWVNTTTNFAYICVDNTVSAAIWKIIISSSIGYSYQATNNKASTTAVIPADDTKPQNTEGTQIFSITYTPKKTNSVIFLKLLGNFGHDLANEGLVVVALFDSSVGADAIFATIDSVGNPACITPTSISHVILNSSGAARTYSVRYGWDGIAGTTAYFNRPQAGARFNSTVWSIFEIYEYA